jgi:hypothetical protein
LLRLPGAPCLTASPPVEMAKKRKRKKKPSLRPPDTSAGEDDEAVDAYNLAVAAEADSARAAAVATGAASSKEEYVARMIDKVGAVVANIESGDCPMELEAAWVWCQADDWQRTGGIKVLTNYEQQALLMSNMKGTKDAETLEYLFEKGAFRDATRKLGIDVIEESESQISAAAIGAAIDIVVAECEGVLDDEAWIPAGDAERLKRKFQTWLKGVTWGKTYLSPTNRPSLASWEGDPWSASHIMSQRSCGLLSGIPPDSPLVVTWCGLEAETPDRIEQASEGRVKASSFILVWSKRDPGACLGAEAAIKATRTAYYEMFHRLLTEQDGAQKTGSLADFLAKSL